MYTVHVYSTGGRVHSVQRVALVLAPVPLLGRVVVVSPELVVAAGRRGGLRCAHPCLLDADAETVDLPGGRGQVALELQLSLPQSANMKAWVSTGQVRSGKNGGKTYLVS